MSVFLYCFKPSECIKTQHNKKLSVVLPEIWKKNTPANSIIKPWLYDMQLFSVCVCVCEARRVQHSSIRQNKLRPPQTPLMSLNSFCVDIKGSRGQKSGFGLQLSADTNQRSSKVTSALPHTHVQGAVHLKQH